MHGYILWFSMHITGENTVNSYEWVHLVFFYAHYRRKTVNSYAWGHLVVFYAITGENTVHDYAWVHLVVFFAYYW